MRKQRGAVLMVMMATMLVAAAAIAAKSLLAAYAVKTGQVQGSLERLETVKKALVNFAAINGYLPCPANGTALTPAADSGQPAPAGPVATCTNNQTAGVVPWAVLGLTRDQSLDAYGRKFSYRVFQGAAGFTLAGGANCDTDALTNPTGLASTLCTAAGLRLQLSSLPADNNPNVAFLVISHGETGNGAWNAQGGQVTPMPASVEELANCRNPGTAAATFYRLQLSDRSVPVTAANHFDDLVAFVTRDQLASMARRRRNW